MRTGVVLLAAGAGKRFGAAQPKQFLSLNGAPLFVSSLRVFARLPSITEIIVVCLNKHERFISSWAKRIVRRARVTVVEGGAYRGESVRNGVRALSSSVDVVLVHDAARPMVDVAMVRRVERSAKKVGASLAAWPLADTLKLSRGNSTVAKTIPRAGLWLAQTPQGFRRDVALQCLLNPSENATDDVALAERRGYKVAIVEGSATNVKVTYPTDLKLCRLLKK